MALDFSKRATADAPDFSARSRPKAAKDVGGEIMGGAMNLYRSIPFMDEGAAAMDSAYRLATGKAKSIPDAWQQSRELQDVNADDFQKRRPLTTAAIKGTGATASMLVPGGRVANIFSEGALAGNMARGALNAAGNAYVYGVADKGTLQERAAAGNAGATNPLVLTLGAAGGAVAPRAPRAPRQVRPEVRTLSEEGVQMTPGQMMGGAAKHIEDAATSVPILGPAVSAARRRGVEGFNRAVLNRALRPIGEELPEGIQNGHEAIAHAGDRISAGYQAALPEVGVRADPGFTESVAELVPSLQTLTPRNSARMQGIVEERLTSRLGADGRLNGPTYQRVMSELETESKRFSRSTDADEQAMSGAIDGIRKALRDAAARQNPQFGHRIRQLDEAWANITRAETAAANGKDPSGIFTPAQYDSAVRAGSDTVRRRGYARGEALGQDLSSAAKDVLPSSLNDSGTATRGAVGMVLGGGAGVAGGLPGVAATAGGLAVASRAYSPQAISLANRILTRNIARADQQAALVGLRDLARNDPATAELYRQVAARLSSAAGATGAPVAPNPYARP